MRIAKWAAVGVVVASLSGGGLWPWLVGVDRVVQIDQYMDGMPIWFRICTTAPIGACTETEPITGPAGTTRHVDLPMRFRPGRRRTVTVESCNKDGCATPVTVEAEIPIQWEMP